ncbi:DUF2171 domain-containing protein [Sabulicella glaciei]|uniref:DUF2171 domain-containing protein n=1 Tax=Sabulicella glaciei TaxID=2984948 RepID=A0ABT3P1S9_9PROT|nr:DUF2171 domain-containing protein [Roseococcus sp. MDT2-1-1]MCW8088367.1 DUF2171 domain-containing protein [Roseococcus sp. MDT2-1-1]
MIHGITEHMEILGSDGGLVGRVDKVEGDRIKLTKDSDPHHAGHHHTLPLSAVQSTEGGKLTLQMTASEALSKLQKQMG